MGQVGKRSPTREGPQRAARWGAKPSAAERMDWTGGDGRSYQGKSERERGEEAEKEAKGRLKTK